ncbi:hypothetical protein CIW48_21965 [Methylobacterium sp. P1-11]|nr:hypothetical protein CIW48_21965 [Methylobacterium sp. P1-11]
MVPLLPPQKPRTGRPAEDHRQVLNGMLWILRTRGRPRPRPRRTAGDRGCSRPPARCRLRQRRIEPVIPTRKDQPHRLDYDNAAYRERNKVERLIGRLKQYRRIAARDEKRAANYLAMGTLGMTRLWLT